MYDGCGWLVADVLVDDFGGHVFALGADLKRVPADVVELVWDSPMTRRHTIDGEVSRARDVA